MAPTLNKIRNVEIKGKNQVRHESTVNNGLKLPVKGGYNSPTNSG